MTSPEELSQQFRAWWLQSYPTPPGPHAVMTHLAWAKYLLEMIEQERQQDA